mgnify:CR=1 FL=1
MVINHIKVLLSLQTLKSKKSTKSKEAIMPHCTGKRKKKKGKSKPKGY